MVIFEPRINSQNVELYGAWKRRTKSCRPELHTLPTRAHTHSTRSVLFPRLFRVGHHNRDTEGTCSQPLDRSCSPNSLNRLLAFMFFFFRYRRLWQETVTVNPLALALTVAAIDHVDTVDAQLLLSVRQSVVVQTLVQLAI